jgi:Neprosin
LPHQEQGPVEFTKFELEKPGVERGPEGTVPVLRKDIKSIRFNKNLDDFLSKHGHKTRTLMFDQGASIEQPESGGPHDYAYTSQSVTCYGGEGWISAYDPYTNYSDEFSLGQIALLRNSNQGIQTLEAGHQEYRDLYGDWVPHLFVYYTTNGYTSNGDNVGGYNRDVDGWVQYSNSIYPGTIFSPTSTPGGAQYVMHIKYQLWQGNWWLACNGNWIGYYPASLFAPAGLRPQADRIDFFGEIVDSASHSSATKTDMGSGYWAEYRWPYSGYMHNLQYQNDTAGHMTDYSSGSVWSTDTKEYDIEAHMNSGSSWGSYFWFGGPGA